MLASTATVPQPCAELLTEHGHADRLLPVAGYGTTDEDLALRSGDRTATLVAQHALRVDHFVIYEVPIADEFRAAAETKTLSIALAYDPPVRRRRQDYLGVEVRFDLLRGRTLEQVARAYGKLSPREAAEPILHKYLVNLEPKLFSRKTGISRQRSTLQRATWKFERCEARHGDTYFLVVRCQRNWAPASVTEQDVAIAVTMRASKPFFASLEARLTARARAKRGG